MRTTVEFPPDLIRAAKARSASQGESLKALLTRAVAAELGSHPADAQTQSRVVLPIFGETGRRAPNPSNADLERALADDEAAAWRGRAPAGQARRSTSTLASRRRAAR
jgi:hypothetical protein